MRLPTYMSYSSFAAYEKDREEFYLKYLSDNRPPHVPQERPAAVGSAFDAFVKSDLYHLLYGSNDPKYKLESLFEAQVESHNRDFAYEAGLHVFECYRISGAYDRLVDLLKQSEVNPRFEFDVRAEIVGVPFLGKPDCYFKVNGHAIVHDFKVNGYCSKSATSPNKGYKICTDGYVDVKQSQSHNTSHKQFVPQTVDGLVIDTGCLEDCSEAWADQLSLYSWSLGVPIRSQYILSIDQIVAKPITEGKPLLRVASFCARVRPSYQDLLAKRFADAWEVIKSGWIFRDLSEAESKVRCELLDSQSQAMASEAEYYNQIVRPKYRG